MAGSPTRLSKFRLLARLGSGGMAEVYLVLAEGPGGFSKLQVVKLMRSDIGEHERRDFLDMFQDEARLAARLNHPNIVQSYEVGEDGGQPFIVMEYLDGQSLSRVQHRSRHLKVRFPLEMELFALCQVLEGLDYAHQLRDYDGKPLNMVHRDVSPQNVFITYAGQTKLVDFGVAKTLESSKTRAGVVKGKVAYMAPEQVVGGKVDRRADLFSVGVLLWEAIAGTSMHGDLSVYESLNRLVKGDLPRIRDAAPDVPAPLEHIVTRALALSPDDRYDDADAFRVDLLNYLDTCARLRARDVGERVAQLFARERGELNDVIRRAMTTPGGASLSPGDFRGTRMLPDFVSSAAPLHEEEERGSLETRLSPAPTRTPVPGPALGSQRPKPHPRRRALYVGAGAIAVAMAAAATLALRSESAPSPEPLASASAAPDLESVRLSVLARPASARIVLDGRALEANPYDARHTRDAREHRLQVIAPGFHPQEAAVRFDRDVSLQFHLAEVEAHEPPSERPTAAQPARARGESRSEPRHERRNGASRTETAVPEADPYVDLPVPRRQHGQAPELDRSDPWKTERR
ncbi:MAG: serine/threonine-protein kinase [Polyangiales bacterium]